MLLSRLFWRLRSASKNSVSEASRWVLTKTYYTSTLTAVKERITSREKLYTPNRLPRFWPEGICKGEGGGGLYFEAPRGRRPLLFYTPLVCSKPSLKFVKEFLRFSLSRQGPWVENNTKNHKEWPKTSPMATDSD